MVPHTAPLKDASRRVSAVAPAKRPGPSLTGAVRGTWGASGRDEETAPFSRTKKPDQVSGVARQGKGQTFLPTRRSEEAIFTYVIAFGSLLIIAHTGTFPSKIPDDLAILAGGSLGTYVVSKAIQKQADTSKSDSG